MFNYCGAVFSPAAAVQVPYSGNFLVGATNVLDPETKYTLALEVSRARAQFPLALGELGNAAPEVIEALHRHFKSANRLHASLCAFSAWRLSPNDTEAIELVRRELNSRDPYAHARYTLLDDFERWTRTNIGPFVTEVESLVQAPSPADQYKPNVEAGRRMLQGVRAKN